MPEWTPCEQIVQGPAQARLGDRPAAKVDPAAPPVPPRHAWATVCLGLKIMNAMCPAQARLGDG